MRQPHRLTALLTLVAALAPAARAACGQRSALYSIAFDFKWTAAMDPHFPPMDGQDPPSFLELVCASHRANYTMWTPGEPLRRAMQRWVRGGRKAAAVDALLTPIYFYSVRNVSVLSFARGTPRVAEADGAVVVDLPFRGLDGFSFLSCVSRLWPSPDWFVGIASLDLCASGNWSDLVTQPLPAWDAGVFISDDYDATADPTPEPTPRPVARATGKGARDYGTVTVTKALSDRPTPPQRVEPAPAVCIAAAHLRDLPSSALVFATHRPAEVLCDAAGSCATARHVVVWRGAALTMGEYCARVGACARAVLPVNSPRYAAGLRVASETAGLSFTAHAARFDTRLERLALRLLVAAGG